MWMFPILTLRRSPLGWTVVEARRSNRVWSGIVIHTRVSSVLFLELALSIEKSFRWPWTLSPSQIRNSSNFKAQSHQETTSLPDSHEYDASHTETNSETQTLKPILRTGPPTARTTDRVTDKQQATTPEKFLCEKPGNILLINFFRHRRSEHQGTRSHSLLFFLSYILHID